MANGLGASGTFQIDAYKNHTLLSVYNGGDTYSIFSGLNATHYGTGAANTETENITYGVSDYGTSTSLTLTSLAGEFSSGSSNEGPATANLNFNAITYAGGAYVITSSNGVISNLTYTSTSGFDYQHAASAAVPGPGTWALFLLGISAMWLARRRTSRAVPVTSSRTS